ncbi:hypothetical protein DL96DRAFT_273238 [Flagelloscypha sp. PMI_526]|nr:hypothetical protein DL96DRAFT_273238 [Flagelloscypha sp. PMI_526]
MFKDGHQRDLCYTCSPNYSLVTLDHSEDHKSYPARSPTPAEGFPSSSTPSSDVRLFSWQSSNAFLTLEGIAEQFRNMNAFNRGVLQTEARRTAMSPLNIRRSHDEIRLSLLPESNVILVHHVDEGVITSGQPLGPASTLFDSSSLTTSEQSSILSFLESFDPWNTDMSHDIPYFDPLPLPGLKPTAVPPYTA